MFNKTIKSLQLATSISTIIKIAIDNGFKSINFLSLGNKIEKVKFAAIKLIEIRDLLLGYRANSSTVVKTILKMLALERTEDDYYNILIKGGVMLRYHDSVINGFTKILHYLSFLLTSNHP